MKALHYLYLTTITILIVSCSAGNKYESPLQSETGVFPDSVWIEDKEISGIGYKEGISRRDPSDIIEVDGKFYVWYTKIPLVTAGERTRLYNSGYYGTIWYAVSEDGGFSWVEKGKALGPGPKGEFDSHAVFTPNILFAEDKYYLFYTAVKPTPGNQEGIFENNSTNDYTAIGIAVSNRPSGPFERLCPDPALAVSEDPQLFDSYRVDDAALIYRENKYWLYYKGRSLSHGPGGPAHTRMGVAFSESPEGPYTKQGPPILDRSHEVLIWNHLDGVAALASISSTLEYAPDGLDFDTMDNGLKIKRRPSAPGLFRPHLTNRKDKSIPGWGISMGNKAGHIYLRRLEFRSN